MKFTSIWAGRALLLAMTAALAVNPAFADNKHDKHDKPNKPNKHDKHNGGKHQDRDDDRNERQGRHFDDGKRVLVREYYVQEYRSGHCPPGLAKKNNGCMPPGQAKKWNKGRPLPRDVVYYDVPKQLIVRLGAPPSGHKYVRVASDILLIAIGTSMVVDAITDLGRM